MLTADQVELRKSGIGASELPAALGLDPYQTPFDLWALKTGLVGPDPGTLHTRLGNLLEPVILTLYSEEHGTHVYPSPGTLRHSAEPWLLATPDALGARRPGDEPAWIIEAKHRGHWNRHGWGERGTDQVPDAVAVQVHAQLAVTGYPFGDVAVLLSGYDVRFYRIHADSALAAGLLDLGRAFWSEHVLAGVAPAPVAQDNEKLGRLLRQTTDALKPATPEIEAALLQLRDCRGRLESSEQERQLLEAMIKMAIGEDLGVECAAGKVTWKTSKPSRLTDWEAVAEDLFVRFALHPDMRAELIAAKTREKLGSRRFLPSFTPIQEK